jgi:hypothetical protein
MRLLDPRRTVGNVLGDSMFLLEGGFCFHNRLGNVMLPVQRDTTELKLS